MSAKEIIDRGVVDDIENWPEDRRADGAERKIEECLKGV